MDNKYIIEYLKKKIKVTKNDNKGDELDVGIEITVEMAKNIIKNLKSIIK